MSIVIEIEYGKEYEYIDEYIATADYVEPFVKGRYTGPPEKCYPDEGGYVENFTCKVKYHGSDVFVACDNEELIGRYADYMGISRDKANEEICLNLMEYCIDNADDDYPHWFLSYEEG
jgi:hypothetical protein